MSADAAARCPRQDAGKTAPRQHAADRDKRSTLEQLRVACELMQKHQGRDARDLLPAALPPPLVFQPNKEYVRQILRDQIELTGNGEGYVPLGDLPPGHRFFDDQQATSPAARRPASR